MNALMSMLEKAPTIEATVDNKKLMKKVTIEYFSKDEYELCFCKGLDKDGILRESVLVAEANFTEADYVALVNVKRGEKGTKASQAFKISKKEFESLLKQGDIL